MTRLKVLVYYILLISCMVIEFYSGWHHKINRHFGKAHSSIYAFIDGLKVFFRGEEDRKDQKHTAQLLVGNADEPSGSQAQLATSDSGQLPGSQRERFYAHRSKLERDLCLRYQAKDAHYFTKPRRVGLIRYLVDMATIVAMKPPLPERKKKEKEKK